jgi:hypothetical protein
MNLLLPNMTAGVQQIDRAVDLLRTVSKSLNRVAESALAEYGEGEDGDDAATGAHIG